MLAQAVYPGCGRGCSEELEEIGFRQGRGYLRSQCSGLLGDTVKLPAEAGDFVKGGGRGGV